LIGFPDLEKNGSMAIGQERIHELPGDAVAAEFGRHRQVEELIFVLGHGARHQESRHAILADRDAEIVLHILSDIPLDGFGAGGLDGGDLRQMVNFSAPDFGHLDVLCA